MSAVLFTVLMFIVAISILVAVHEFGHFWVAKRLGVKVLRFSIGIGKPIWTLRAGKDQTEYVVSALPLGGYVKMLDEREGDVDQGDRSRAFNRQAIWKRIAIVLAGPLFNFIFAIIAYWFLYITGISGVKPVIGEVHQNSYAERAALPVNAEILRVNNKLTPTLEEVAMYVLPALVDRRNITLEVRDATGKISTHTLEIKEHRGGLDNKLKDPFKTLGFAPYRTPIPPVIDDVAAGKAAEQAGLRKGDRIVKLDAEEIQDWVDIPVFLQKHCNKTLKVTYERNGEIQTTQVNNYIDIVHGVATSRVGIVKNVGPYSLPQSFSVKFVLSPWEAFDRAMERTRHITEVSIKLLWSILKLEFSFKNIGSPLQIATVAGKTADMGYDRFIIFLALVSISLGIMNLLPIPILDGGHLLYYLSELITGKPVSEQTEVIGQKIGLMLLVLLMLLAFYNDIMRMILPGYGIVDCPGAPL